MNPPAKIESTIHSAMAAAFAEIESATKSAPGQIGQQKYKYADLTAVIEAIKPALINHGLFFTQRPRPSDGGVNVETVLGHTSGAEISLGSLFVPANKNDAQAFGSALTYARRYALVTAFGVPVEDDDGHAASKNAGGQFEQRQVSPRHPDCPPKSHLDAAEKRMVHEIEGCGDGDQLDLYLATKEAKADYKALNQWRPEAIHGPPPEGMDGFIPIADRIKTKRDEFALAVANHMADLART